MRVAERSRRAGLDDRDGGPGPFRATIRWSVVWPGLRRLIFALWWLHVTHFLAIGTKFNQGMTQDWSLDLPETTIRIDIDPAEIERNLPMQHKVIGDAQVTLNAIESYLAESGVDRQGKMSPKMSEVRMEYRTALRAKGWGNCILAGSLTREVCPAIRSSARI